MHSLPSSSCVEFLPSPPVPPSHGGDGDEAGDCGARALARADGHGHMCGDDARGGGGGDSGARAWCLEWNPAWCWLRLWCPCGSGRSVGAAYFELACGRGGYYSSGRVYLT